jgi:hypothetical protein
MAITPRALKPEFLIATASNVVLQNISWQTYQAMLVDMGDRRSARLNYDHGVLEIRRHSDLHEVINRLLARIVMSDTGDSISIVRAVRKWLKERS